MSYCVNCGVELAEGTRQCPLCNTPVINPNNLQMFSGVSSFPEKKGQVERVGRKDIGILTSVILAAIAITCGLLNAIVFQGPLWSLAVIGACMMIWVLHIPIVIYTETSVYASFIFDGLAIGLYLYLIARMIDRYEWFFQIGIPVVILTTALVLIVTLCIKKISSSFLAVLLYLFTAIGIFCLGLDLQIDFYRNLKLMVSWSAVVATVCLILDVAVITLMCHKSLRHAVHRRMHF